LASDTQTFEPILKLDSVSASYGKIRVLKDVSLEVYPEEIATLIGGNGAGKSTTLKTICGLIRLREGSITFMGERIDLLQPHRILEKGISLVPEGRHVFSKMSVMENLEMGAYARSDNGEIKRDLDWVLSLFPVLKDRTRQVAGTLSGGEQQMLAMGRALMSRPRILLLDEPSMGLAPILVEFIYDIISSINRQGTAVLLVEQNAHVALDVAGRGYVMQTGEIALADSAARLKENVMVRKLYLGEE
jgi:branched-chain amino acid transport system ATP-binding protein